MHATPSRVLIVEDDAATADTYARILRLEGYDVRTALTAEAAFREVDAWPPDAMIVDLRMPLVDGLAFLRGLRARDDTRHTPVAIATGDYFLDETIPAQIAALSATVRFKPLWLEDLTLLVQELLNVPR